MGLTPSEAKANCRGKTNKVPVNSFKQALRDLISIDHLNVLEPLTSEEVKAFFKDAVLAEQMEIARIELDKIDAFIAAYG